jgi:hypothetical protein
MGRELLKHNSVFFSGDKVREGPTLVGVFLEGATSTCQIRDYVAKKNTMKPRHLISNPVVKKWDEELVHSHKLWWNTVWIKGRIKKEARLLWLIWHR